MTGQNIGYIRVSSVDQNEGRQLEGIALDEKFVEKASGKDTKRPKLKECLKHCRKGDILHVHSIDRLARNLADLERLLKELTGKGVAVEFHKEGLKFTGEASPFQQLHLQIIGAVAQFERAIIHERQAEGIAAAKAKGKHLGRPHSMTVEMVEEAKRRVKEGESKTKIAVSMGVSKSTLYAKLKEA